MTAAIAANDDFIHCWNEILTPKWIRFRHLLSGNGKMHSDRSLARLPLSQGARVLDFGCGFGETSLEFGRRVGPTGEVVGLDCTQSFLAIAERERDEAGLRQVAFVLGDAQVHPLPEDHFDLAYARFGVMFFESSVRALRNVHRALVPGGTLALVVWRSLADNPAWGLAKDVVREVLPPPADTAQTCGPGPFSWADEATDRAILEASGFHSVDTFERVDVDICVGTTLEEAIDYQLLVGPSGEIVREAGALGQRALPELRERLAARLQPYLRQEGVYLPSSTWFIAAKKA